MGCERFDPAHVMSHFTKRWEVTMLKVVGSDSEVEVGMVRRSRRIGGGSENTLRKFLGAAGAMHRSLLLACLTGNILPSLLDSLAPILCFMPC